MNSEDLFNKIKEKSSFLCVGLDTDYNKIPKLLLKKEYPIFEFNKRIVEATADLVVAYKPNIAFYESLGTAGWMSLEMTINYIRENYPDIFLIADAKRGDIGNTSDMYARAFFTNLDFDAITLSPYMGKDSIQPFLEYPQKWAVVLGLTSNDGADDFQQLEIEEKKYLYEEVIHKVASWGNKDNTMFVVGATKAEQLDVIRAIVPDHFLLIPGVGAQGGSLEEVVEHGMNDRCGLLVNASRSIIYADVTNNFEVAARQATIEIRDQMELLLKKEKLI